MARSITEIYNSIIAEKANQPALVNLTSNSQTAVWRLWAYIFATAIWVHETLWDTLKLELEEIARNAITGTGPWYRGKALEFQWSASVQYYLVFDEANRVVYNITAPDDRIVHYAAVTERNDGVVVVKAARDNAGTPLPLTTPQLVSFINYMKTLRFAGVAMEIISLNADSARVYFDIYYTNGVNFTLLQADVEAAINDYLSALPFDGTVYVEHLQDAVQAVTGVKSVFIQSVECGNPTNLVPFVPVARVYETLAGYIKVDTTAGFTLADTLNYIGA